MADTYESLSTIKLQTARTFSFTGDSAKVICLADFKIFVNNSKEQIALVCSVSLEATLQNIRLFLGSGHSWLMFTNVDIDVVLAGQPNAEILAAKTDQMNPKSTCS